MSPLVSVLCATHDREAFMPWLAWNFARQTHDALELVLVDSTPYAPVAQALFRSRPDVLYVQSTDSRIGPKLQLALELASGAFVCVWCDDDWQHPERIARQVAAIGDDDVVGYQNGLFVRLEDLRAEPYLNRSITTPAVNALVRAGAARLATFEPRPAEDTHWIAGVLRRTVRKRALDDFAHSFWLVHGRNTCRRDYRFGWAEEKLREYAAGAWGDTERALAELRQRLRG